MGADHSRRIRPLTTGLALLAIALPAASFAQPSAAGTYTGTFKPSAGYQGTTPRMVSLRVIGGRFSGLRISGGEVKCVTDTQPLRTFFYKLPALSGFPGFGRVRSPLYLIFNQTTVMQPAGPWALANGTPLNETADVRLYGKWTHQGYTGLIAINYAADLEGHPTTSPNANTQAATQINAEHQSSCTLDETGTLRLAKPRSGRVATAKAAAPASPKHRGVTSAVRAKAPGSSCRHPVYSSQSLDGAPGQRSDTKDFGVKVTTVSDPNPGSSDPMTLQLEVTIHNPRVVICRAVISAVTPDNQHLTEYPVRISPRGEVLSTVTIPARDNYAGVVYARLRPRRGK
jgi:hypothetical protein